MKYAILATALAQLLAVSNAAPQPQDQNQLCHESDGRISDTRWAEMFGILGIISAQPGRYSAYTFVINEYDGHYLVRQNGCYQTVPEASDLMNQKVNAPGMVFLSQQTIYYNDSSYYAKKEKRGKTGVERRGKLLWTTQQLQANS